MSFTEILFFIFIGVTVVPAFFILFTKNVIYAAFLLLITFLGIAGLYVFAGADFLGVAQIMVYVGGILVLLLFGIMIANRVAGEKTVVSESKNLFFGTLLGAVIFSGLFIGIVKANFSAVQWIQQSETSEASTIPVIGENLMTTFVLPMEVSAILLMVALMGAGFFNRIPIGLYGYGNRRTVI